MSAGARPPLLYRILLKLFPRAFREQFGDDMAILFVDRRRETGHSWKARLDLWTRSTGDLFTQALAERWRRGRSRPARRRGDASPLEQLLADARYALRMLWRSPGFAGAAVATLALGIGANVAIFSVVNGVLLQPLPYPEPERLVRVWPENNHNKAIIQRADDASPALEMVSGMSGWLFTLTGEGDPQQISGVLVSWDHFDLLGVRPALGRSFTPEEGVIGQADAVILSHGLWVNVFGADPGIIGRRIRLAAGDYQTRRVVGVMPADFQPIEPWYRLWAPLDVDPTLAVGDDSSWYVNVLLGRLAAGATAEQASSQVRALASALHEEWPTRFEEEDARLATVVPLQAHRVSNLRGTLWTLLAAAGVVLLIACVNVANLLLARSTARSRDLGMRVALGATRGRIIRQMLTESLVLGTGGCVAGLAVAWAGIRLLAAGAPEEYYQVADASIDPAVMAFAAAVSLAAVLMSGLVPAWRAASAGAQEGLAGSGRGIAGAAGGRLSKGLVAAEVALSVVLVAGAGLMLRSLWNLYTEDLGFNPRGVLTFRISIPEGRFEPEALRVHYREIWDAVRAVPGVDEAGGIQLLPLSGSNWSFPYVAEGHPVAEGTPPPHANIRIVTPSYFETLRIPLLSGRTFSGQDSAASEPVGLINERMARELWPEGDPVGKTIKVYGSPFTVAGVVGDIYQHGLHREVQPEMYRPYEQWPTAGMFAVIRTQSDPAALAASVQRAIWDVDAEAPIAQLRPMEEVFGESVAADRFVSLLITTFGALALLLGAIGVYGVTAYTIGRRLGEFGVRMALGADRAAVLRQAIGDGLKPALLGVAAGLVAAWWATRALAGLLYEVGAFDRATFAAVPAVLIAVAALACALPAWRASRLDPTTVLRQE
jgi:predicted permease